MVKNMSQAFEILRNLLCMTLFPLWTLTRNSHFHIIRTSTFRKHTHSVFSGIPENTGHYLYADILCCLKDFTKQQGKWSKVLILLRKVTFLLIKYVVIREPTLGLRISFMNTAKVMPTPHWRLGKSHQTQGADLSMLQDRPRVRPTMLFHLPSLCLIMNKPHIPHIPPS